MVHHGAASLLTGHDRSAAHTAALVLTTNEHPGSAPAAARPADPSVSEKPAPAVAPYARGNPIGGRSGERETCDG
ncbi:hypothetical protein GCM10010335_12540 [Streptomyces galbus]|nr:hypothetical protein GCM10010335_12540 [Streptomyces galbus]